MFKSPNRGTEGADFQLRKYSVGFQQIEQPETRMYP